jgi:hypothetical protein
LLFTISLRSNTLEHSEEFYWLPVSNQDNTAGRRIAGSISFGPRTPKTTQREYSPTDCDLSSAFQAHPALANTICSRKRDECA